MNPAEFLIRAYRGNRSKSSPLVLQQGRGLCSGESCSGRVLDFVKSTHASPAEALAFFREYCRVMNGACSGSDRKFRNRFALIIAAGILGSVGIPFSSGCGCVDSCNVAFGPESCPPHEESGCPAEYKCPGEF